MITNLTILNATELETDEDSSFKNVFVDEEGVDEELTSVFPEEELEDLEVEPEKRVEGGETLYRASDNNGMLFILPAIGLFFIILFGILVCWIGRDITRENQPVPTNEETFWDRQLSPGNQRLCYKVSLAMVLLFTAAFSICTFHNIGEMLK